MNLDQLRSIAKSVFFSTAIFFTIFLFESSAIAFERYPSSEIESGCKLAFAKVDSSIPVSDIFIDRDFLRMLVKPFADTYYFSDVVELFFKKKLLAIETGNSETDGNALIHDYKHLKDIVRLSIQPDSDQRCENYDYTRQYPAQAYPWLRALGLPLGMCVAVEYSSNIQSKVQIKVKKQIVGEQYNGLDWQAKYDVTLSGPTTSGDRVAAKMSDFYARGGGGKAGFHHFFPCGWKDEKVRQFISAIDVFHNEQIIVPQKRFWPPDLQIQVGQSVSDERLRALVWVAKVGKVTSSNIIDNVGSVWVTWAPKKEHFGYEFNVLKDGAINSSWIMFPIKGLLDVTGLAITKNGYAVIGYINRYAPDGQSYLVEFDDMGRQTAISKITFEQHLQLEK